MMFGGASLIETVVRNAPESGAAIERLATRALTARSAVVLSPEVVAGMRADLRLCVEQLELMALAACVLEVLSDHPELPRHEQVALVGRSVGIDLERTLRDISVPEGPTPTLDDIAPRAATELVTLVPYLRHRTASCPIEQIEQVFRGLGDPGDAHRARRAYDALHSFLLRHDPSTHDRLKVVGRLHAAGQLSIGDASALLGCSVPDAVALLEARGYARSLDVIRLQPEARADLLARVRADRLRRGGAPAPSEERVQRNVIASERIEGIDARAWLADD